MNFEEKNLYLKVAKSFFDDTTAIEKYYESFASFYSNVMRDKQILNLYRANGINKEDALLTNMLS